MLLTKQQELLSAFSLILIQHAHFFISVDILLTWQEPLLIRKLKVFLGIS